MKRVAIIFLAVALAVVIAGAVWWHEINVVPEVSIPKPPPTPSPNAYDYFVAARTLDRDSGKWNFADGNRPPGYRDPDDPDDRYYSLAEKEELLRENLPMIAKVRQGFSYPYYPQEKSPFFDWNFSKFSEDARMLGFASEVYGEEGNWDSAVITGLDGMQLGMQIPQHGGLSDRLVGIGCQVIVRQHVWDAVDHLSGADARSAALRLERIQKSEFPLAETIQGEKWRTQASLLHAFQTKGWDGTIVGAGVFWAKGRMGTFKDYMRMLFTSKRAVVLGYSRYMDAYGERCRLSYPAAKKRPPLAVPSDPINSLMLSIFDNTLRVSEAEADTQNNLLMASLALRAYRADHGSYPATLSTRATLSSCSPA